MPLSLTVLLAGITMMEPGLAPGRVLLATRASHDADLGRAVVLLVHFDRDGAIGLMLNRVTDVPLNRVYPGIHSGQAVFLGGPVAVGARALMRCSAPIPGALPILPSVYAFADRKQIEAATGSGARADRFRVYAGYVGWTVAQLESEVKAGLWRVRRGSAADVFDAHPETLWQRLAARPR